MLLLIIVLVLVFGLGGGYYGNSRWGPSGGAGIGVGTIVLILLIAYNRLYAGLIPLRLRAPRSTAPISSKETY